MKPKVACSLASKFSVINGLVRGRAGAAQKILATSPKPTKNVIQLSELQTSS
jgi:hypothetical protein